MALGEVQESRTRFRAASAEKMQEQREKLQEKPDSSDEEE